MSAPTIAGNTRDFGGVTIPTPGSFVLDASHSVVGFVARHLVVSKVRGSFTDVSGTITIAEDPYASGVEVTIGAGSIETGAPDRDNHLRSGDFLDIEKFPHLTFRSLRVSEVDDNEFKLVGELTIRDVTREVVLDVEFDGVAQNPWGKEIIAFTATTEIDREEFGITWNMALETGGVLVGRKVKIEISAQAIRQDGAAA